MPMHKIGNIAILGGNNDNFANYKLFNLFVHLVNAVAKNL